MKLYAFALALSACVLFTGCSVTKEIKNGSAARLKPIQTASQISESGNSPEMNTILQDAIVAEGVKVLPALPPGTRKQTDADVLVSYADVWKWDFVMFLQTITIRIFDAETGELLVSGRWADAPLHGYRDAKLTVRELISDMFANLRSNTKQK